MKNMNKILSFLILLALNMMQANAAIKWNSAYQNYINKYKDIAVEQMQAYRVPASITLAQGLLESGAGLSRLATKANNHFGIKCHNGWSGGTIYVDDDIKNDCFRAYGSARESFIDHSKFLQGNRYKSLFSLSTTDYKGWARGLKACGYATLPTYANRLIGIIELYELYRYDKKGGGKKSKSYVAIGAQHPLYLINNLDCIIAREGDTWESLSRELKERGIRLSARKLRKYNEAPSKYFFPSAGTPIFLQKKLKHADRDKYPKDYWHRIQPGESMYSIAQMYGVRIKYLYKMNYRKADYVPEPGDILRVR